MQKHVPKLLAALLGLGLTAGLLAAKAPTESKQYDYVTLEKMGNYLYISQGATSYEERKVKEETKDVQHHQGPLLQAIQGYEAQGYEVYTMNSSGYSSSGGTTMSRFVVLRKPK